MEIRMVGMGNKFLGILVDTSDIPTNLSYRPTIDARFV